MKKLEIKTDNQLNNKTVKYLLFNHLELSDKLVTDLKKGKYIKVNGNDCTVRNILKVGDIVTITVPKQKQTA